jgi:hypothetical protein
VATCPGAAAHNVPTGGSQAGICHPRIVGTRAPLDRISILKSAYDMGQASRCCVGLRRQRRHPQHLLRRLRQPRQHKVLVVHEVRIAPQLTVENPDRLIRFYPFSDIDVAERDARSGEIIKPIVLPGE